MTTSNKCAVCGSSLQGAGVYGQCPYCLIAIGFLESPEPGADLVGLKLRYFGDYELLAEVARGGMGIVYQARQVSLNRAVALKMILPQHLSSPLIVHRFHTEAEAVARLAHPNIVPIYEIGEHEGHHYFTMRFFEGGTLAQAMARAGFGARRSAEFMVLVARAVQHAHQHGILHRDLKPGNILLNGEFEPHVADFGLAKVLEKNSTVTQTAALMGTPSYMAPEQAIGDRQLTTATDVYGLGAILYELLTGQPPFKGSTPVETIRKLLDCHPTDPRALNPSVDKDLVTVCLKCLEKAPQHRYPSADAFACDLERWLRNEPIAARPVGLLERAHKWARRKRALAALTGVSVLAGGLFLGGLIIANVIITGQRGELRSALQREQRDAYFQSIALAEREWSASNVKRAHEILESCKDSPWRGWEWSHLKRLHNSHLHEFKGGQAKIICVTEGSEGRLLSFGADGFLRRCSMHTSREEWAVPIVSNSAC